VFGHVQLAPRWQIFAHGEWQRPSRIVSPNERDSIVYGGVQFSPMKLVDIALVYKREVVTNGALATANGVIGCAASAAFFAAATPANACTGRGARRIRPVHPVALQACRARGRPPKPALAILPARELPARL
jgi:hypothetical protein